MKKLFFYILLLAVLNAVPFTTFAKKIPPADTIVAMDTAAPPQEYNNDFAKGLNDLVRIQEQRRAKEKKAAMIRIGIGVAFLVVLVIGLSRRRKK
jgi:hypothetical protein